MNILQFCCYYYPHIGGIEQVARDVSNALKEENNIRVICFNHEKGGNVTDNIDGVDVVRAKCFAKVASQQLSFTFKKLLKKQFKEFKPDVLIFHYPNPFAAHYVLKVLKKYPECKLLIYWHLDIYKQKLLKKLFNGQNKRLCKRATLVLGATPVHLQESAYYANFKDKCRILPYGINENRLIASDAVNKKVVEIKDKYKDNHICFAMGRHVPYKGMEYLVRASKLIDRNVKIFIAGQGPLTDYLKELSKDDDKVEMLGKISDDDALAYLLACDVFCFPSITRNEGFGLAMAEAMYLGKPVVNFTIPHSGVNYVSLNEKTGIEVENQNVEEYAEAIVKLLENETLKKDYGQAARQRILENYTFEKFKTNISELIKELSI